MSNIALPVSDSAVDNLLRRMTLADQDEKLAVCLELRDAIIGCRDIKVEIYVHILLSSVRFIMIFEI